LHSTTIFTRRKEEIEEMAQTAVEPFCKFLLILSVIRFSKVSTWGLTVNVLLYFTAVYNIKGILSV
jgi:hypothetical protein